MNLKVPSWLFFVAVFVIVMMIILWPKEQPKSEKVTELERAVAIADIRIASLLQDSAEQAEKRKADSVQQAQEKKKYITTIEKKSREIAVMKANPVVVKIRETTPEVNALLTEMDRMDSVKTDRIATLENNLDGLRIDMAAMEVNFGGIIQAEREKYYAQKAISDELEKELRKAKKKGVVAKILIPVAAVGAFLLGNGL